MSVIVVVMVVLVVKSTHKRVVCEPKFGGAKFQNSFLVFCMNSYVQCADKFWNEGFSKIHTERRRHYCSITHDT